MPLLVALLLMAHFSTYLAQALLNHVFRNSAYTSPATVYVALYTVAPTDAGGGTEVTGGSYARQSAAFSAPSGNQISNSAQVTFPEATANWGTVVAFGVFDAVSGGNFLGWNTITNVTINSGDQRFWNAGELTISLD